VSIDDNKILNKQYYGNQNEANLLTEDTLNMYFIT